MNYLVLVLLALIASGCAQFSVVSTPCNTRELLAEYGLISSPALSKLQLSPTECSRLKGALSELARSDAAAFKASRWSPGRTEAGLALALRDLSLTLEAVEQKNSWSQQLLRENNQLRERISQLEQRITALKRIDERLEQQLWPMK